MNLGAQEGARKGARTVVEERNGWELQQDRIARYAKAMCKRDTGAAFDVLQEEFGSSGAALTVSSYLCAAMESLMDAQEAETRESADDQLRRENAERTRIEQFADTLRDEDNDRGFRILQQEFGAQYARVTYYIGATITVQDQKAQWLTRRSFTYGTLVGAVVGVLVSLVFVALVTWSHS